MENGKGQGKGKKMEFSCHYINLHLTRYDAYLRATTTPRRSRPAGTTALELRIWRLWMGI